MKKKKWEDIRWLIPLGISILAIILQAAALVIRLTL